MIRDMSGKLTYTAGVKGTAGVLTAAVGEKRECREPAAGVAEGGVKYAFTERS